MLRPNNLTEEDETWTRTDIQNFINAGKKAKAPKNKNDVKKWLKVKGMPDELAEKTASDMSSYL